MVDKIIGKNKQKNNRVLLGFPECMIQVEKLASLLEISCAEIDLHYFPDGECKVTLPISIMQESKEVLLYRSLNFPNSKMVELILAAQGCRDYGVETLTLVAPYLAYMRQDIAFAPGEVVSQKVIGKLIAEYFDTVITLDSHLHRIKNLSEAIPVRTAVNLSAKFPISAFLKQQAPYALLIGPDEESLQWVEVIATQAGLDYVIAKKQRLGDKEVIIELPDYNYHDRACVLLDDMSSSGGTLLKTAEALKGFEPASISVIVTHALFTQDVMESLLRVGIENVWSTETVPHPSNVVEVSSVLAEFLQSSD